MKIKVLVTDDHQLFREGLVNLLFSAPDIEVIAQAKDGKDAIEKAKHYKPDVVLMDIGMPVMNGIEATGVLKTTMPDVKIVAVSMHSDWQYVKGILEAGADGYLLKNCTYRQLTDAIKSVYAGKKYLSEDITELVISGYLDPSKSVQDSYAELSEREKEIFILLAEGKSTREISDKLFISVKTVGTHKQNLLEKLSLKTTADIVKYAIKKGLIRLD
ncbi:MAG: response regulator transcription factor [Prolixibacteraceae bacterium]|jgi:two-component system, NarL family, response regulator NreC|nr:response regulator transcription factor [Prolixibacteraceae bacterium]MBT6004658.1 response regulator transcription factor [Prolixibacteraceae bacterium]MBT6765980.1 response regulator transcription factor [Prolixibacteraceae bacterium]MBT6996964.1 response regulator transcription factor [Prolixibacteraceae bacterium]MBT7395372.1 response regulator transcription factor [Prolixibacteraceae bacterium]